MRVLQHQDKWLISPIYAKFILFALPFIYFEFMLKFNGVSIVFADLTGFFTDFHAFYAAGFVAQNGNFSDVYSAQMFVEAQKNLIPNNSFMPWTYPPQFGLIVALFPFVSIGTAYAIFVLSTSALFFVTFRQLAGRYWATILFIGIPAIAINFACGQNGFLTGFLIALFCLIYMKKPALAGIPLGLMIIKPHLVLGIGVYLLLRRQWPTLAVAFATVVVTSILTTVVFGLPVWWGFYKGLREMSFFMETGLYPFYRMTSTYAFVRTVGFPHGTALGLQAVSAAIAVYMIWRTTKAASFTEREKLGVAVLLSTLFSPYFYDYDQLILLIALALLVPSISQKNQIMVPLVSCIFMFTSIGFIISSVWANEIIDNGHLPVAILSPSAPLLWCVIALIIVGMNAHKSKDCSYSLKIC